MCMYVGSGVVFEHSLEVWCGIFQVSKGSWVGEEVKFIAIVCSGAEFVVRSLTKLIWISVLSLNTYVTLHVTSSLWR